MAFMKVSSDNVKSDFGKIDDLFKNIDYVRLRSFSMLGLGVN